MNRTLLVANFMLVVAFLATAQKTPESMLGAALHQEEVQGDLKGAVAAYQKVVAAPGVSRKTAAEALVRMAGCYQKLGDKEARRIYERVVKDYGDQREAVTVARARLGSDGANAKGDRPVWIGPNVDLFGTVSPDGRFLTYVDWIQTGNLILHDLSAGTDRPLTNNVSYGSLGQASWSAISGDGQKVAYEWTNDKGRIELRISSLQGTGVPESRAVFHSEEIRQIRPYGWSPDGKWLAVHLTRQDLTGQIALIAAQDGALRTLKSTDWRQPGRICFSPDGRYIAYDLPVNDAGDQGHILILTIDGSRETVAVDSSSRNVVMGWSQDNQQHLLFASDRSGKLALWALSVVDGKPRGGPKLVKSDIGSSWSLGLTASGTLYVYKGGDGRYVQVAPIDLNAGNLRVSPTGAVQRFIGSGGHPSWSPDGKYLAYSSCDREVNAFCRLTISSLETGQIRELRPKMSYLGDPHWSRDGRSLNTDGTDFKGRRALYRIDAQTGEISLAAPRPGAIVQWSPDEKKIYYRNDGGIVERDLATGKDRDLFRRRANGNSISIAVSPDGRYIASVESGVKTQTVLLIPTAGGEPQELLRASVPEGFDGYRMIWTPDGRAVVLIKSLAKGQELWLVPVSGGQPTKLDIDVNDWVIAGGGFSLDPEGRQIAFVAEAGKMGPEVWALENVLPKPVGSK